MVLVDTSVWIDHLRSGSGRLSGLLERSEVISHPMVTGELACGNLHNRSEIIGLLQDLPQADLADCDEVMGFIEAESLAGKGLGWVDVNLLASARLMGVPLWTQDMALAAAAALLGIGYTDPE